MSDLTKVELGKLIKECRIKEGLSQVDLANKLDMTRQAVSMWESGTNAPSGANLVKLSAIIHLPLSFDKINSFNPHMELRIPFEQGIMNGLPIFGEYTPMIAVPSDVSYNHPNSFATYITSNSMEPLFPEGYVAIIDRERAVNNNEVGAFYIDEEIVLRKKVIVSQTVLLIAENKSFEDMIINSGEIDSFELGKLVYVLLPVSGLESVDPVEDFLSNRH